MKTGVFLITLLLVAGIAPAREVRDVHKDMMRLTLEIVAQCLYSAEVSGSADQVGHALEIVTVSFVKAAGRALLFPFHIPDPFAWKERRAIRELNVGAISNATPSDRLREKRRWA